MTVRDTIYEPGQSSGWHRHRGTHVVTVLAGVLTVYDGECSAHSYRPGETYIGGRDAHLARNEGPDETRMVVTFIADPSDSSQETFAAPMPVGCQLS